MHFVSGKTKSAYVKDFGKTKEEKMAKKESRVKKTDSEKEILKLIKKEAQRAIEKTILRFLAFKTTKDSLNEEVEALKKYLTIYVEENFIGLTADNFYKFWQGNTAGVELQDNPSYEVSVRGLISEIGLPVAIKYLSVDRAKLLGDLKAKTIKIKEKTLKKITLTTYGQEKVIAYYGRKNKSQTVLPKIRIKK